MIIIEGRILLSLGRAARVRVGYLMGLIALRASFASHRTIECVMVTKDLVGLIANVYICASNVYH